MFERFFRGRRARAGGSGIGLTVARELVVAHGGALTVESELARDDVHGPPADGFTPRARLIHRSFIPPRYGWGERRTGMKTRWIWIGLVTGLALVLTVGFAFGAGRPMSPVDRQDASMMQAQASNRSDGWACMDTMHDSAYMEQMRAQMGPELAAQCDAMHEQMQQQMHEGMREHMGGVGGAMGPGNDGRLRPGRHDGPRTRWHDGPGPARRDDGELRRP